MIDSENEVKKIVKESVLETLLGLGFDVSEIHEHQADMIYLRRLRKGSESMSERIRGAIIAVSIPTLLFLIWQSVKNIIRQD